MAEFIPSKKLATDFNGGQKYINEKSSPNADDFNNVIESALYSQQLAEEMSGGSADAVLYTAQSLTEEQKQQARTNIDAVDTQTVGDIDTSLDEIIGIQESLMGGNSGSGSTSSVYYHSCIFTPADSSSVRYNCCFNLLTSSSNLFSEMSYDEFNSLLQQYSYSGMGNYIVASGLYGSKPIVGISGNSNGIYIYYIDGSNITFDIFTSVPTQQYFYDIVKKI